ncbi:PREDICTED: tyrosine-protein kinase STYK1-like [Crocodylus porosus]|uniref:Tyrosine-protein kinase STYK1-like n=1 Tax=Crocodylus porosus TaxID=8502 RepID=A0A7M4F9B2_CROPO|nr:PREDICTED: tyrosine-protein kinase STYK1-like [Crocodylus porosus]XP_019396927.1 PREDICTED: tyrosine-protein kinase STYK1-like [Crocodylus porosus]XP_019396928.1 PREDICTED: tyrosine-protein kinase STYK1-like [Crocodylus porosus]XP_019396930.1 PREDICTED: tyrosine-protein kinase STYK1-like [Crocodylus porosus]
MGSQPPSCNFSSGDYLCDENGMQNPVIIIPSLLAFSTLLVVGMILWRICWRKQDTEVEPIIFLEDEQDEYDSLAAAEKILQRKDPLLAMWELPQDRHIQQEQFLCAGRYGQISQATIIQRGSSETVQAVILRKLPATTNPKEVRDFLDVMKFHIQICNHDSLVKVLWCQSQALPFCIVLEAMSLGNLLPFLWKACQGDLSIAEHTYCLTEKRVYAMGIQIARGLEYLTVSQRLIHGNVAAYNILIHQDLTVRLCGLGLAAKVYCRGTLPLRSAAEVPIKWLPPERILNQPITARSDVWSFGILLYEMITLGAPPYPTLRPADVLAALQREHRMKRPEQCGTRLYRVMRSCWRWKPSHRPAFPELLEQLDSHAGRAGTKPLTGPERLNLDHYQRLAGLSPREAAFGLCSQPGAGGRRTAL